MTEAIVNITDAVPTAVRIPLTDLRPTDVVFDVFGGEYPLTKVQHFKHRVRFTRSDGHTVSWPYTDVEWERGAGWKTVPATMTVKRGAA